MFVERSEDQARLKSPFTGIALPPQRRSLRRFAAEQRLGAVLEMFSCKDDINKQEIVVKSMIKSISNEEIVVRK